MKIKLNKLTIRNFKGIKEYEFEPNGSSTNVSGGNGTGKTTLYDAFLWSLFGKDSTDKAQFDWKPLDNEGNEINHLETEVIAELEIDSRVLKLSRMVEENWTKKRGAAVETFTGHTTTYRVNDLVVKKKEYDETLAEIISEDLFKLLTNVHYFPEVMKWDERRQMLIDMVGDITDEDVIKNNSELEALKELIEERPADELKQLTAQEKRQINKDLKAIPNRIDEVDRSLPDISKLDKKELENQKELIEKRIATTQSEIASLKNSDATVKAKSELADLKVHYRELEMDHKEEQAKELEETLNEQERLEDWYRKNTNRLREIEQELKDFNSELTRKNTAVKELEEANKDLRTKFEEVQKETIDSFEKHQTSCPTCGQELPEEQVMELKHKHELRVKDFNQDKANRIKWINEQGIENKKKIEELKEEIDKLFSENMNKNEKEQNELLKQQRNLKEQIKGIKEDAEKIRSGQSNFAETEKAREITKEGDKLNKQIDSGSASVDEEVEELNKDIKEKQDELSAINQSLQQLELHKQQVRRKEELIAQEQDLSAKYGELEQRLYLLEEFTREKVSLLTETINDKFNQVRFKLFDEQINGSLVETCEVTVGGANYSTGLNNAARINAGLDIIGTLMDHHAIKVPVFIDNAESINEIADIDTQLITLTVSNHKTLNVSEL